MKTTLFTLRREKLDGASARRIALPVRFAEELPDNFDVCILRKERRGVRLAHCFDLYSPPWPEMEKRAFPSGLFRYYC